MHKKLTCMVNNRAGFVFGTIVNNGFNKINVYR